MNIEAITDITVRNAPKAEPVAPAAQTTAPKADVVETKPLLRDGEATAADHAEEPERAEVEQVLEGINTFLKSDGSHIQFSMHQEAQRLMVQVIDNDTQEVVRTFPPKELLDLAARIGEMVGTLIDQTG